MSTHGLQLRAWALLAAVLVLVAGVAVWSFTRGPFAEYAGGVLYAMLVYALVLVVAPRLSWLPAASIALLLCCVVEFAQLTALPAELSARSTLARLVLGTTFSAFDLIWYAAGVLVAAGLHVAAYRRLWQRERSC